jgi:hypothetical protein
MLRSTKIYSICFVLVALVSTASRCTAQLDPDPPDGKRIAPVTLAANEAATPNDPSVFASAAHPTAAESSPADPLDENISTVPYDIGEECALRAKLPPPPMPAFSSFAMGVYISTLGPGVEAAVPVGNRFNLRADFNIFSYSTNITQSGITYGADLTLRSAQISLDWFPHGRKFHISPGMLLYNGNRMAANLLIPTNTSFSLNNVTYFSDPADPLTGSAKISFPFAGPQFTVGYGNMLPRWKKVHLSFPLEVGAAYFGDGNTSIQFTGSACTALGGINCMPVNSFSRFQSDVYAEEVIVNNDLHYARIFPILRYGISYKF